jgi:hypothetical protein
VNSDGIKNVAKRRPHGLLGLREAEYRVAHPGQHNRRGGRSSRFEHAVKIWERVLTSPEVTEYDISPWDALLVSVKLAAGRVAWTDRQLKEAIVAAGDNVLRDQAVRRWQQESRNERKLLGQLARDAIAAGIQEHLVRQVELETQLLDNVLQSTLQKIPGLDARWYTWLVTSAWDEVRASASPDGSPAELPPPPEVPVILPQLTTRG